MSQATQSTAPPMAAGSQDPVTPRKIDSLRMVYNWRRAGAGTDVKCKACGWIASQSKLDRELGHLRKCEKTDRVVKSIVFRDATAKGLYDPAKSDLKQLLCDLVIDFVAVRMLPLRTAQSFHLNELLRMVDPSHELMSRAKFRLALSERARDIRATSLTGLAASSRFSLTLELDGWKACSRLKIIGLVITTPDGRTNLLDLIDITRIPESAEAICAEAVKAIAEAGLDKGQINAIVTDQGSNYKAARQLLAERIGEDVPLAFRCMAHVVNLIIGLMIKSDPLCKVFKQLLSLVEIIDSRSNLRNYIEQRGGNRVARFISVRWYSASNTINSVLPLRDILDEDEAQTIELGYSRWGSFIHDNSFWNNLGHMKLLFDRLSEAIGLTERADSLLSDSFRTLLEYAEFVIHELPADNPYKPIALKAFLLHFHRLDLPTMLTAYAFNPNHKFQWLTKEAVEFIKVKMLDILLMSNVDYNIVQVEVEWKAYLQLVAQHLNDPNFIGDTHAWWSKRPWTTLKIVGQRMSYCHGSSANTERTFSTLKRMVTPLRNKLKVNTIRDLITVQMGVKSCEEVTYNPRGTGPSEAAITPRETELQELLSVGEEFGACETSQAQQVDDDTGNPPEEPEFEGDGSDLEDSVEEVVTDQTVDAVMASSDMTNFKILIAFTSTSFIELVPVENASTVETNRLSLQERREKARQDAANIS